MATKTVLFFRDYSHFSGGQLKLWHYYQYFRLNPHFQPYIYFTPRSNWDNNPWAALRNTPEIIDSYEPEKFDLLFLEGRDWPAVDSLVRNLDRPKINLIQDFWHTDPNSELHTYLDRPAIRICTSQDLQAALLRTNRLRGKLYCIPNGIDLTEISTYRKYSPREIDLFIDATKHSRLGLLLYWAIRSIIKFKDPSFNIKLIRGRIPRAEYLAILSRTRTALFLPRPKGEGFYMPPLEAMALGVMAACPDRKGNRTYLKANRNCFVPAYNFAAILITVCRMITIPPQKAGLIVKAGLETAREFSLQRERKRFGEVLMENGFRGY